MGTVIGSIVALVQTAYAICVLLPLGLFFIMIKSFLKIAFFGKKGSEVGDDFNQFWQSFVEGLQRVWKQALS